MTQIFGHDDQKTALLSAYSSGRMHHGWLFTGAQGLGKAQFARAAAGHILTRRHDWVASDFDADCTSQAGQFLDRGQHPDLLWLTLGPKDDKEMRKMLDGKPFDLARNIRIDQIRALQQKLNMRPSMAERRVIVIDSVDLLERGAANALLKTLEEPPANTLLFLVSHNPGKLLPTIRSRCITLKFNPLSLTDMERALAVAAPDMRAEVRTLLAETSGGSPGAALQSHLTGMPDVQRLMREIARRGDRDQSVRMSLVSSLKAKGNRDRMAAFVAYAPVFAAHEARGKQGRALAQAIAIWEELTMLAEQAPTFNFTGDALAYHIGGLLARLVPPR